MCRLNKDADTTRSLLGFKAATAVAQKELTVVAAAELLWQAPSAAPPLTPKCVRGVLLGFFGASTLLCS